MALDRPNFRLDKPNPNPTYVTNAEWWLWLRLKEMSPGSKLGGIIAWKKGFHATGQYNLDRYPSNYSIRDLMNRTGPWWRGKSSALDWTFPDAQAGRYGVIDKYTSRLVSSAMNPADPRLDLILYEFYGQADWDSEVEGWNEVKDVPASSDKSHLWHIHFSFRRNKCGDFWAMWALVTVLLGWSVGKWRATLATAPPAPIPVVSPVPGGLPVHRRGARELSLKTPAMRGTDVQYVQKWVGPRAGAADGEYGPATKAGVRWYQAMRSIPVDGIVGPRTWREMGVR